MNQATFNDGRRIAKNPEAETLFMEFPNARQPTIGGLVAASFGTRGSQERAL